MLKITTRHRKSRFGVPVFLDGLGRVLKGIDGLRRFEDVVGWTRAEIAVRSGKSKRTIEGYFLGRFKIPAEVMNVLRDALEDEGMH